MEARRAPEECDRVEPPELPPSLGVALGVARLQLRGPDAAPCARREAVGGFRFGASAHPPAMARGLNRKVLRVIPVMADP